MHQDSRQLGRIEQLLVALIERVDSAKHDINKRLNKLEQRIMSDQDTINQIAANLGDVQTELATITTSATNVEAELAKLIAAQGSGQPLDFSALQTAVANLKGSADNINTLLPDPGPQS